IALIAKELAKRGWFDVSLIVADHGQPHKEQREGVALYSWVGRPFWGIPIPANQSKDAKRSHRVTGRMSNWLKARFVRLVRPGVRPPLPSGQIGPYIVEAELISIYDEVDADIYMVPGNSQLSGEMAFYCRQRKKKYVLLAGSDIDFILEYKTEPEKFDLYGVPYCLKAYVIENAHMYITQNEHQTNLLRQGYGRVATTIRNPIALIPEFPGDLEGKTI